jgi:hypothetical protein
MVVNNGIQYFRHRLDPWLPVDTDRQIWSIIVKRPNFALSWLLQIRIGKWCDRVKGEHGFSVEKQEHMPTGSAGRETSHNSGPLYAPSSLTRYAK